MTHDAVTFDDILDPPEVLCPGCRAVLTSPGPLCRSCQEALDPEDAA
jgi:predicted amidophosphoribosyltransferase